LQLHQTPLASLVCFSECDFRPVSAFYTSNSTSRLREVVAIKPWAIWAKKRALQIEGHSSRPAANFKGVGHFLIDPSPSANVDWVQIGSSRPKVKQHPGGITGLFGALRPRSLVRPLNLDEATGLP